MKTLADARREVEEIKKRLQDARDRGWIVINDGVPMGGGMAFVVRLDYASGATRSFESEPDESQLVFYERAVRIAESEGATIAVWGGFPAEPVEADDVAHS